MNWTSSCRKWTFLTQPVAEGESCLKSFEIENNTVPTLDTMHPPWQCTSLASTSWHGPLAVKLLLTTALLHLHIQNFLWLHFLCELLPPCRVVRFCHLPSSANSVSGSSTLPPTSGALTTGTSRPQKKTNRTEKKTEDQDQEKTKTNDLFITFQT